MAQRNDFDDEILDHIEEHITNTEENIAESIQNNVLESLQDTAQGQEKGAMSLLRISTVLLAVVSFWATAQGMAEYVFAEAWQAYAASLAIQGILLGLNFYLPTFWRKINLNSQKKSSAGTEGFSGERRRTEKRKKKEQRLQNLPKQVGLIALTCVVLFCSSWFSFVFIVGQVYKTSWGVESRLLIQSTYRKELYNASDYVSAYEEVLRDTLNNQILDLYRQAKEIGKNEVKTDDIIIPTERETYTAEGFAAQTVMSAVLDALEAAQATDATQATKERAMEIIVEMRGNLEATVASLTEQVNSANEDATQANDNLQRAQARLNNAPSEVDTTQHIRAIDSALSILQRRQDRLQELQKQRDDNQRALDRIRFYEISLGLASSGSSNLITASLRMIQQELFKDNPDLTSLETQAASIFQQLQAASNTAENDGQTYMELLRDTNQFIDDLQKYRSLRTAGVQLDELIEGMRTNAEVLVSDDNSWKASWSERLDGLKSLIGSLPAYSSELYENNSPLLLEYDRAKSADALDGMIRLYLANHNAAQQGLIYLFNNPHPGLAWFSLVLAFFLDIAAFTTGLLIDIIDRYNSSSGQTAKLKTPQAAGKSDPKIQPQENEESIPQQDTDEEPPSHPAYEPDAFEITAATPRYIYLTGDYIVIDGETTYCGIEHGKEGEYPISGPLLKKGMYLLPPKASAEKSENFCKLQERKELRFLDAAQDGIYPDCKLKYEDGALSIMEQSKTEVPETEKQFVFLGNAELNIPVFLLVQMNEQADNKIAETLPIDSLNDIMLNIADLREWLSMAIIRLNKKGSRIAAIYLICDES